MKISVDGGALNLKNNKRFGTSIFSENIIKALQFYDKKNQYKIYTFENLKPKIFWMKVRVSIEEFRLRNDVFLGLNQALPLYIAGKTISFCHGLSYYFYPQYYPNKDVIRLNRQLKEMIKRSDKIIVSSKNVKSELISIDRLARRNLDEGGTIANKVEVLPFGIPFDLLDKPAFAKATADKKKYFLFVGNNQPIKNIDFILQSFNRLKCDKNFKNYKLYLVGNWVKYEDKKQGIFVFENITRQSLKKLYQKAVALLTASHYESFNFPVLEALSLGCPVIGLNSAIITELKPFANLANNIEEFALKMKKIPVKPTLQSFNRLKYLFNWKNYVENLVKLY